MFRPFAWRTHWLAVAVGVTGCLALGASAAQTAPVSADPQSHYVRAGDTIFVSGRLAHWFGTLLAQFAHPDDAGAVRADANHPERRVRHIVFVNALGRPERTLGVDMLSPRLQGRSVRMTVMGRCDLFCARIFMLGTQRAFGQDLPGQGSWIDIRPPIDLQTQQWVNREPEQQVQALTRARPELLAYAARWSDAMRRTQDASGGLRLYLDRPAQFCPSAGHACETWPDMTAQAIGLVTERNRVPVTLPATLADASPDAPWPPFYDPE
ncbi:hypothetical protein BLL52_0274 [Rhodoferax antarcticus ANT.BR]|uniref:Lipoprotein n=1 Tax=Rhodoferax antarcticus ANT.BR TaxID=1111071 RepID=A0A1Q8YKU6_9BURK|nr:hypothetical protein BLL52_0274 [Rhodoferax antarcticus ANT.BR]